MIKRICEWIVRRSGINAEIDGKIRNIEQPKIERIRIAEVPARINPEAISYRDMVMEGLLEGLRGLDERLKTREQMEVIAAPEEPTWMHPKSINSVRVNVIERAKQEEMMRRDEVLAALDARIKDMDNRLRRADPIVQQAISQGDGSMKLGMIQDLHRRVESMEQNMKQLAAPEPKPMAALLAPQSGITVGVSGNESLAGLGTRPPAGERVVAKETPQAGPANETGGSLKPTPEANA